MLGKLAKLYCSVGVSANLKCVTPFTKSTLFGPILHYSDTMFISCLSLKIVQIHLFKVSMLIIRGSEVIRLQDKLFPWNCIHHSKAEKIEMIKS